MARTRVEDQEDKLIVAGRGFFDRKSPTARLNERSKGWLARLEREPERLYAVSLVTAEATVRALLSDSPDQISLYSLDEVAERPRQCFEFPKND